MKKQKVRLILLGLLMTTSAFSENNKNLEGESEVYIKDGKIIADVTVLQEMISYYENNDKSSFAPTAKHRYCVPVPDYSSNTMICNDCVSQPFGGAVGLAYCALKHGHTAYHGRCNEPRNQSRCGR